MLFVFLDSPKLIVSQSYAQMQNALDFISIAETLPVMILQQCEWLYLSPSPNILLSSHSYALEEVGVSRSEGNRRKGVAFPHCIQSSFEVCILKRGTMPDCAAYDSLIGLCFTGSTLKEKNRSGEKKPAKRVCISALCRAVVIVVACVCQKRNKIFRLSAAVK